MFVLGSLPCGNAKIIAENNGTTALQRSFMRAASLKQPAEYTEGSASVRVTLWKATARMITAHPLVGVGAGAWEVQIPLYLSNEIDFYPHNEVLQLLAEYGLLVGGLFLAVLFACLLLAAGKTWRLSGANLTEAPLRALILCSLLALLIVSNAEFPWHLATTCALLALGLHDAHRLFAQPAKSYSWWDYRDLAWRRNHGMRIDHILVSHALRPRVSACWIDKTPRNNERPSDHAPVVVAIGAAP
ncbi:exodeoxyribonuclease III [mine drainage metagenome]|uniref:Exodeoxyribonuclease III n=1 Tax=mine drainage metagenome TaxID=410659 RepID=A0A1J5PEL6_9ZZZZ